MLLDTVSAIIVPCLACGRVEAYALPLFHFSTADIWKARCSCGHAPVAVRRSEAGKYYVHVWCTVCEVRHFFRLGAKDLWPEEAWALYCPETRMEIAYFGLMQDVRPSLPEGAAVTPRREGNYS